MEIIAAHQESIEIAAKLLGQGHLIGVPTETVYGLAADATNDLAVAKIFATKGRPSFNPLIVHVTCLEQAARYAAFTPLAQKLAEKFWPGPLTLVLPRKSGLSDLVSAGLDSVAIRCPAHPVMHDLIATLGKPLAAPSANPSGSMSPTTAQHVADGFAQSKEPVLVLDGGACAIGLESTVVDARGSEAIILRAGGITLEQLQPICPARYSEGQADVIAPGMLARHYAPNHFIRINATEVYADEVLLAFGDALLDAKMTLNLSPQGDLIEAAANLFSMLHQLDAIESAGIAVMPIPNHGIGVAINDRLVRAAERDS